ncbi:hypothetical protein A3K42_01520 [candidate division WWE3 bacterium RBG_13_37_7]|uniref:PrcB C-terminal domain-containing protein n=1 Tax=candidate division WWE3 bacterium RBG_13_37_7 TaxID=1802609 RepID=A0A1F4U0Q6_UNCKA|nr:MAG: hypothetical protein A3K42_01520 [candidate division WWE3 bacterium RBG_13_37_7]
MNEFNQKANLRISLIPLVILIILILGAGYLLLEGEIKLPKFNRGPQIKRLEGFPTIVYTDKQIEKQRKVIKSEQELTEFLNLIDPSGLLEVRDKIDFNKEYLLAATTETENETGHSVKIRRVYEDKNNSTLLVSIQEEEAGSNCDVEMDKNISVDIASISKTDWNIEFDRTKQINQCNKN